MPIKDAIRIFTCKYCGKEFKMFIRSNGELITFPDNYPWPIHGEFELTDHIRRDHKDQHESALIFYRDRTEEINRSYAVS